MTPDQIKAIADLYRVSPHVPEHPSYRAFVRDTVQQFRGLLRDGWSFARSDSEPYATSVEMLADLDRKYLTVLSSINTTFGKSHPLAKYKRLSYYQTWQINEVFRAVHDVLGHGPTKCPFETFEGEMEAYANHARVYSPEAIPALFGETVGQLCHYFAGYGFVAVQKCVIYPPEYYL